MNDQKAIDKQQERTAKELDRLKRGRVGDDVPDESKEHHTEIAVEAGRKGGERHDEADRKTGERPADKPKP